MSKVPSELVLPALSVHYSHPNCTGLLENAIYGLLDRLNPNFDRELVYLCIGTDRATGDCLGPLVGTLLQTRLPDLQVFGSLEHPSHAVNLARVVEEISCRYPDPLVIAIDASLGCESRIGYISVQEGGLAPGTALQKNLPIVGDFHLSAVVNVGGYMEQMVLQNTRLFVVYRMAELISQGIFGAHTRHNTDRLLRSFAKTVGSPAVAQ